MLDSCAAPGLMPLAQAKMQLLAKITPLTTTEMIAISECDQRVNAVDLVSPVNVPAFDNSAMDGYALCIDDALLVEGVIADNRVFQQVGTALAGQPYEGKLSSGQCVRIMTGAIAPQGANAVEMQENVQLENSTIELNQAVKLGQNIRLAGDDIRQNTLLFPSGHVFNAVDIGLLASLGIAEIAVIRKPKVAVFSTGDELKAAGQTLSAGDIYESNRHVIIALLQRMNIDVLDLGIIADDKALIKAAFLQADSAADAVISSGGVSVGDADYTKEVLAELGEIDFWKVAMKPGKPFAFGLLPNSVFFGLPGNPVSATVTFHQLAAVGLKKLAAGVTESRLTLKAITASNIKKRPGRIDFQRGIASNNEQGDLVVTPLSHQGSGVLSSLSLANCYIVLAQDTGNVLAGDTVNIELFDRILA